MQKHPPKHFQGVLKNFTKFTGKYLCQSPFFNKVRPEACNFTEKRDADTDVLLLILGNFQNTFFTEHF